VREKGGNAIRTTGLRRGPTEKEAVKGRYNWARTENKEKIKHQQIGRASN